MAARTMRTASSSLSVGMPRWYPPSPSIETSSAVRPSVRRAMGPWEDTGSSLAHGSRARATTGAVPSVAGSWHGPAGAGRWQAASALLSARQNPAQGNAEQADGDENGDGQCHLGGAEIAPD